jgi:hypothetical protein
VRIDRVDADAPPKLRLFVTDLDEQGRARPSAADRSYQLLINSLPEAATPRVTTVAGAGEPVSITCVVQVGPSMEPVLPILKKGLEEIVGGVAQTSSFRIITFADQVVADGAASTPADSRKLVDAIAIRSEALEMQLLEAVQAALKPANGALPHHVVVVSDGTARELSPYKFTELGDFAKRKLVPIHAIAFVPIDEVPMRSTLSVLSKKSRGTERVARTDAELADALRGVADEMRHQRILEYDLPGIFTGKRAEFQIDAGPIASEPIEVDLPLYERPTQIPWKPIGVLAVGVALAVAGYAFMALRKRRRAAAQAILEKLKQAPPPAAALDLGKTMPGLRRPEGLAPKPESRPAKPEPVKDGDRADTKIARREDLPDPPRPRASIPEPDTVPPKADLPRIDEPKEAPKVWQRSEDPPRDEQPATPFAALPRPTEFLRMMGGEPAPTPSVAAVPQVVPPSTGDLESTQPLLAPKLEDLDATIIPPKAPPLEENAPRFSTNRTQVISSLELESVDVAGWIVPIPDGQPTLILKNGFTIGTQSGDHRVKPKADRPKDARFDLDALGRWVVTTSKGTRALEDGDTFDVGASTFLYKFAARFPMAATDRTPYLQIVGGIDDGRRIRLDGPRIIGSDPAASGIVRGRGVQPRHAVARVEGGACQIADLSGDGGLETDGKRVPITKLEPNQEVRIGAVRLVFRVPSG